MIPAGREEMFRRLFAQEAAQRLASLGQHLLALEADGADDELVASVFRDAHNLKGAAAVVGIEDVARVAHAMEDLLEQLRSKVRPPTADVVDVLLAATDGLKALVPVVIGGQDGSADADALEHRLRGVISTAVVDDVDPAVAGDAPPDRSGTSAIEASPQPAAPGLPPPSPRSAGRLSDGDTETVMVPVSRLDELVRLVGESASAHLRLGRLLTDRWGVDVGTVSEFRDLSRVLNDLQERTMRARMVPVATITESLRRAARDVSRGSGKKVRWEVRGGETELDRGVLQQLADPLLHLVRNAVDHGIETPAQRVAAGKPEHSTLVLHAVQLGSEVIIDVVDDGRGINVQAVLERAIQRGTDVSGLDDEKALFLIFGSGLSTARTVSEVSGRGVGLDAVRAGVEAVRGRIEVHSSPGVGTRFRIIVPITMAILSCLLVEAGQERYALPMHSVVFTQARRACVEAHAEGRPMLWMGDSPVEVSSLARTLRGGSRPDGGDVVVMVDAGRRHAFLVDRLIGQRDVVVKGLSPLLPRLNVLAGASVEPDGSILLVLDVAGLVERARTGARPSAAPDQSGDVALAATGPEGVGLGPPDTASVLVVDDSATICQFERTILEGAGYVVRTAKDGVEALARLSEAACDLVVTDIQMPRMDGFALTEAIRADPGLANLPVLIVTSVGNPQSRQQGMEAGADGYIVKAAFDEAALLSAVSRLLGRPR